jgi:hypothetical protein
MVFVPHPDVFVSLPSEGKYIRDMMHGETEFAAPFLSEEMIVSIFEATGDMMVKEYLGEEGVYIYTYIDDPQEFKKYVKFSVGRLDPIYDEAKGIDELVGYDGKSIHDSMYICVKNQFDVPDEGYCYIYAVDLTNGKKFPVANLNMKHNKSLIKKLRVHAAIMQKLFEANLRRKNAVSDTWKTDADHELIKFIRQHYGFELTQRDCNKLRDKKIMEGRSCMNLVTVCIDSKGYVEVLPTCIYNPVAKNTDQQ